MARLIKPVFFSRQFGLPEHSLEARNLLDPILNADTKVFIDPLLLGQSAEPLIANEGRSLLRRRFQDIINLAMGSKREGDAPWRGAMNLLDLGERRETCLGFGGSSVSGSSRPDSLKKRIIQTTIEIVSIGVDDPELIAMMGFLEDDVGPDTISDLATNAIFPALVSITQRACTELGIPMAPARVGRNSYNLPLNPFASGQQGVVLVPRDILRDLPIATDWSDVSRVAFENARLRDEVNALIADFAKATIREKKRAIKQAVLSSPAREAQRVLDGLREENAPYDVKADPDGIYSFQEAVRRVAQDYPLHLAQPVSRTSADLMAIVNAIIAQFKQLVENQDVGDLLWHGDVPKKEKAAQLLFYAVAESYCRANNIDVSPETNSGGGPVDFKFSAGYNPRCVLEIKLSSGRVEHGYTTQLDVYQKAVAGSESNFLIVDVGGMGKKFKKISSAHDTELAAGRKAPPIHVIDARRKVSASKRRPKSQQ